MRGLKLALIGVGFIGVLCGRVLAQSQVLTLDEAARAAENNNRSIRVAELEQKKGVGRGQRRTNIPPADILVDCSRIPTPVSVGSYP